MKNFLSILPPKNFFLSCTYLFELSYELFIFDLPSNEFQFEEYQTLTFPHKYLENFYNWSTVFLCTLYLCNLYSHTVSYEETVIYTNHRSFGYMYGYL